MTYDEAVLYKENQAKHFVEGELTFTVYITPKSNDDFDNYEKSFRLQIRSVNTILDEFSKLFSRNNEYSVRGICYFADINMLYHRLLK